MIYENPYYFIGGDGGLCFKSNGDYIRESNDWSYLIGNRKYTLPTKTSEVIDKDVVCFITAFSSGLHAFVGVLSIIDKYIRSEVKNKTIIVNEDLQGGVMELIVNMVRPEEIITLKKDQTYKFKSIHLIPNSLHSYFEDVRIRDEIVETINHKIPERVDGVEAKIAIIKHPESSVASKMGEISLEDADTFCSNNGFNRVEPSLLGETGTINTLRQASHLAVSWGTTFMKNFVYISEKCKKIDVFIFGPQFAYEYNQAQLRGILPTKYKNADISYHLNPNITAIKI